MTVGRLLLLIVALSALLAGATTLTCCCVAVISVLTLVDSRPKRGSIEREVDEDRKLVADIVDSWMGKPPTFEGGLTRIEFERQVEQRMRGWHMTDRGIQPLFEGLTPAELADADPLKPPPPPPPPPRGPVKYKQRSEKYKQPPKNRNPQSGAGGLLQIRPADSTQVRITSIFGVPAHLMGADEIRRNVGLSSHGEPAPADPDEVLRWLVKDGEVVRCEPDRPDPGEDSET